MARREVDPEVNLIHCTATSYTEDRTSRRATRKTRADAEALAEQHNRDAARREERDRIKRRYLGEEDAKRFPIEKHRDAVDALAIIPARRRKRASMAMLHGVADELGWRRGD